MGRRAVLLLACAACGEGLFDARGRADVRRIGPEGGEVVSRDGRLRLRFPPGAFAAAETVVIRQTEAVSWSIGPIYSVSPANLTLAVPAAAELGQGPAEGYRARGTMARVGASGEPVPVTSAWSDGARIFAELAELGAVAAVQPQCAEPIECADGYRCLEGACQPCPVDAPCLAHPAHPGPHNTGVPPGTVLSRIDGDVVLDQAGAVLEDKDIRGRLIIAADDVTVRRCLVRGPLPTEINGIVNIAGARALLEDVEIFADHPSPVQWGVIGSGFTARRLNVHRTVVGLSLKAGARLERSWIHHLDPSAPKYGVVVFSGTGIDVIGNNIHGPSAEVGAAIFVNQSEGPSGDIRVEDNWLDHGGCIVNFAHDPAPSLLGMVARNNGFGPHTMFECAILISTQTELISDGNVWEETGVAVTVQQHD